MATALDGELAATVHAWMAHDPDAGDRTELQALLDRAGAGDEDAAADLTRRFAGRLAFGTAGLRAELGAGPMRMNRLVVRRAAAGLMRFLDPGATVVIGFDARHRSDAFARDTAGVVAAAGGRALLLPVVVPTPVLAFAIRDLGADAGVMCTASHNPPSDNGYKVYLGDGAQIIPPVDAAIAARIDEVAAEPEPPPLAAADDPAIEHLTGEVIDAYLRHAVATGRPGPRRLRIVYTPLHGVGRDVAVDVLRRAGFTDIHQVTEQAEPDPDFPTVAFPNPEEPGALDRAIALARRVDADVILANDPDADRLGVAVPAAPWMTPTEVRGDPGDRTWVALTGNEIGALLADHVLQHGTGGERLVVTTFVSSSLLHRIAADHGVHAAEVPTGFKWVVRPGLEDPSLRFVFGFEEALGFSVDEYVRDKDGVTAALAFAELTAACSAATRSVWDALEGLARRHGHHATRTWSVRFPGPDAHAEMRAVMDRLRAEPPAQVGPHAVTEVRDMLASSPTPADATSGAARPPADAVVVHLGPAGRIIVRPSGTEPKIKVYLEVVVEVAAGSDGYPQARRDGDTRLEDLRLAFAAHAGLPG